MSENSHDLPPEQQLSCRVCRSGSTETTPLFHPCKCSGSIAYVHQDCLENWLKVSKKTACEICGHTYNFTKLYSDQDVEKLTWIFYLKALSKKCITAVLKQEWMMLVATTWLVIVPVIVLQSYQCLFHPWSLWKQHVVNALAGLGNIGFHVGTIISAPTSELQGHYEHLISDGIKLIISLFSEVIRGHVLVYVILGIVSLIYLAYSSFVTEVTRADREERQRREAALAALGTPFRRQQNPQRARPTLARRPQLAEFHHPSHGPAQAPPDLPVTRLVILRHRLEILQIFAHHIETRNPHLRGSMTPPLLRARLPEPRRGGSTEEQIGLPVQSAQVHLFNPDQQIIPAGPWPFHRSSDFDADDSHPPHYVSETDYLLLKRDLGALIELALHEGADEVLGDLNVLTTQIHPSRHMELDRLNFVKQLVAFELHVTRLAIIQHYSAPELGQQQANNQVQEPNHMEEEGDDDDDVNDGDAENQEPNPNNEPAPAEEAAPANNNILNIDINVNLNQEGNLEAQVIAQGDWTAFLDLIGYNSLYTLVLYSGIATMVLMVACFLLIFFPWYVGLVTFYFWEHMWIPWTRNAVHLGIRGLRKATDFWMDPLVDMAWILVEPLFRVFSAAIVAESVFDATHQMPSMELAEEVVASTEFGQETASLGVEKHHMFDILQRAKLILLGHTVICFFALFFLLRAAPRNSRYIKAVTKIKDSVSLYVGKALKFVFFIIIELGVFPVYCGIVVDLLTVPFFFPGSSVASRFVFHKEHPWLYMIIHWMIGTSFMFRFASSIAQLRKMVRPGVFWFIRDPNDPAFQPMQDILDKPVLSQLRKVVIGVLMYTGIIICFVGGIVLTGLGLERLLHANDGPFKLLPLRFQIGNRVDFPNDGIFYQLCFEYFVQAIDSESLSHKFIKSWLLWIARRLCLTNFLFGLPSPRDEENSDPSENRYLRVPNHDHVKLVPSEAVMRNIGADEPVFGREGETPDEVRSNWTKVFIPNYFRFRLLTLVIAHLLGAVVTVSSFLFIPLVMGRLFLLYVVRGHGDSGAASYDALSVVLSEEDDGEAQVLPSRQDLIVPDMHAYTIGLFFVYVAIGAAYCAYLGVQGLKFRPAAPQAVPVVHPAEEAQLLLAAHDAQPPQAVRPNVPEEKFKDNVHVQRLFKYLALYLPVGVVLPYLAGLLVDIYIMSSFAVVPLNSSAENFNRWVMGCIILKIGYLCVLLSPDNRVKTSLMRARNVGLPRLDLLDLYKNVILPVALMGFSLALLPFAMEWAHHRYGHSSENLSFVIKQAPIIIIGARIAYEVILNVYQSILNWITQVKDEEFLVGRTLHNVNE